MELVAVSESHFRLLANDNENVDENSCILFHSPDTKNVIKSFIQVASNGRTLYKPAIQRQISDCLNANTVILSRVNISNFKEAGFTEVDSLWLLGFHPVDFSPHFACSATLASLNTYDKIEILSSDECIKNYFKTTRYLCDGDLISIDTKEYAPEIFVRRTFPEKLYFKVMSLDGLAYTVQDRNCVNCGYLINLDRCTVHQVPPVLNYIPRYNFGYFLKSSFFGYPIIPNGLDNEAVKIERMMIPFFTMQMKLTSVFLITGRSGTGKTILLSSLAAKHGLHYISENCLSIQSSNAIQTEKVISNILTKISNVLPCLLHFRYVEGFCRDESGNSDDRTIDFFIKRIKSNTSNLPLFIFCTSHSSSDLSPALKRMFLQSLHISPPDLDSRASMLKWILTRMQVEYDELCTTELARATPNFVYADLVQLVNRSVRSVISSSGKNKTWSKLCKSHIDSALKEMSIAYADSLGAPEIPTVTWDDVGGLSELKKEILSSLYMSSSSTLRRSGILLYGPPGTGKTVLAKAIATECKYNFLSVKGPELLNMYVGQSEKNVRDVFARARECVPCIIFFDEFDSLAPKRGMSGGSGSVMDRVVSQLLAEMDGIQNKSEIFVLAATNRYDLIDSALLRPGRLDKMLFVDGCNDFESRLNVLKAVTRKFNKSSNVNFDMLVKEIPPFQKTTGADLYGLSSQAWLNAARRTIKLSKRIDLEQFSDEKVCVSQEDFLLAFAGLKNSNN